eukprot:12421824-Karenia_brevis.AAC.1
MRWVGTDKWFMRGSYDVRCRMVAKDFKGKETPPLEAKRMLMSRAVTRRRDELPPECHCPKGSCGKLNFWMYGMRGAASAWERHHAEKFSSIGFERGVSCGVVFYHSERDISLAVHGDDFTFCGADRDFKWARKYMEEWYEIKVRAILGPDVYDETE